MLSAAHLLRNIHPDPVLSLHGNDGLVLRFSPRLVLGIFIFLRLLGRLLGVLGFFFGLFGNLRRRFVRDEALAAVAASLKLVVSDASLFAHVGVDRLSGVSVNGEQLERLAEEGLDEEGHGGRWGVAVGGEGVKWWVAWGGVKEGGVSAYGVRSLILRRGRGAVVLECEV